MNQPLVSVMVPSRGRVAHLAKSIDSLRNLATDPKRFEVLVWADDDDQPTMDFVYSPGFIYPSGPLTKALIGPRGRGYADLHSFYNRLCGIASGRFLFLWNDDAEMTTTGWDAEIAKHDNGKPCYILSGLKDTRGRDNWLFPIVHRSWFDTMGHFSMSPHNDTYIYNAFTPYPHLFRPSQIVIQHNALQMLHDTTSREAQQWWPTTKKGWDSPEVQTALRTDITKLGEMVKQNS
jgi:hypothetical protein